MIDEDDSYSEIAGTQLDKIEAGEDSGLAAAVLTARELIFEAPGLAQSMSTAIIDGQGKIVMRLPVVGYPPYRVFWTTGGPRVEAIFPYP